MVYFGTCAVSLNREHITADVLGIVLKERGRHIRDLISEAFNVSMIVMVLWKLVPYTIQLSTKRNASTVLRMPQYIMFATFGIGFALLAIVHLWNVVQIARSLSSGHSQNGEEVQK
jgi:TRAP-type C4-dicarboxylate transport system permease small subunit